MKVPHIRITYFIILSFFSLTNSSYASLDNLKMFNYYHKKGVAIQLSRHSLGIGFYTAKHSFTFGGGIGPYTYVKNKNGNDNYLDYHIYGRKNLPITTRTQVGLGIILGNRSGKEGGKTINRDFNVGPYLIVEYAATKHVLLAGSLTIYNYRSTKLSGQEALTTHKAFAGGSLQFAYLF